MKLLKLLLILALPLLVGCGGKESVKEAPVEDSGSITAKPPGELVRSFVESDAYINLDVKALIYGELNPTSRVENNVTEEERAMMKAAVYRFYKHVSIVDSQYVWDLKSGADINISEDIFNAFVNSLQEGNNQIKACNAKGEKISLGEVTEEYLELLLK